MIKECIREVLLEEGMLSRIVKETAEGLSGVQILKEQKQSEEQKKQRIEESHKKNIEARKKLLDSIGTQKFGGVDVFENTSPMPAESSGNSPLSGQDPNDAGVDISVLPGMKNWGKLL